MVKKIGIIGLGNISNKHILSIKALGFNNIYCYDKNKEKIKETVLKYNIVGCFSLDEIIDECDVISVCTPHDSHIAIIKSVLENDKICITEKPLCINLYELDELSKIDTTKCYVMFQNRYNNAVKIAKDIISRGELGDIYYIKGFTKWHRDDIYYSSSKWKGKRLREGGILYNQGIHNIDTALWLVGKNYSTNDVKILSSIKDKFRNLNIETEDYFSIVLGIGNIKYDYSLITYGDKSIPENSLLIVGSKGSLKIGGNALNLLEYVNIGGNIKNHNNGEQFNDVYGSGHLKVYELVLKGRFNELPTFNDGVKNTELIELLYKK